MGLSELQNFDYLVIAMLLSSIYVGWRNGLIVSLIAFFAWFGSAIIVFDSYESLFNIITPYIHSKFISGFIASIGFYIILVIAFSMLGSKISKITDKFGGSATDKVTGAVFGGFCGALIVCSVFWCCYMTLFTLNDQKFPDWFAKAKSYKALKIGSDSIVSIAFSEEERKKLLNLIQYKSNKLEDEVKTNLENKKKEYSMSTSENEDSAEEVYE